MIAAGRSGGIGGEVYYGYRPNLYQDVCDAFRRQGLTVNDDGIRLVKGLFQETLPQVECEAVCLAHVDCDLYDPVLLCLSWLGDRMARGGAIIIDDYEYYGGCRAATDEFLGAHPEFTADLSESMRLTRRP